MRTSNSRHEGLRGHSATSAAAAAELAVLTALPPHPHVVPLLGSSRTATHLLVVLELLSGSLDAP